MVQFKDLDILVFGMSGGRVDVTLPLICQPHIQPRSGTLQRKYFANFIGNVTHSIRGEVIKLRDSRYYITQKKHSLDEYCSVLDQSVFTLCPRGYGPTSFRIMEALQYGSIPVYISDYFRLPHEKPFDYGILVTPPELPKLSEILKMADVPYLQKLGRKAYKEIFTYEANLKFIHEKLSDHSSL